MGLRPPRGHCASADVQLRLRLLPLSHPNTKHERNHLPLLLALTLLWINAPLVRAASCQDALDSAQDLGFTALNSLQPCLARKWEGGLLRITNSATHRFLPASGQPQELDLAFHDDVFLEIASGAHASVENALLQGVVLQPPGATTAFKLRAFAVLSGGLLSMHGSVLETDCGTLDAYAAWVQQRAPPGVNLTSNGDVAAASWSADPSYTLTSVRLTCARPAVLSSSPGAGTVLGVATGMDLYNALALAHTYGGSLLELQLTAAVVTLDSALWSAQGVSVRRNVSIASSAGFPGGAQAVLDLQDLLAAIHLPAGVYITLANVTLVNLAMVKGFNPIPNTGLGLVASLLWVFEYPRSLEGPTAEQVQVHDAALVVYPAELAHMQAWAAFITITTGPLAPAAASFRVGIKGVEFDNTTAPSELMLRELIAYGLSYRNVLLRAPYAGLALSARAPLVPLYALSLPAETTVVGVWDSGDLLLALQGLAQLPACNLVSNVTLYIQLFANVTLRRDDWPTPSVRTSCSIVLAGIPRYSGKTWLNLNLTPSVLDLLGPATVALKHLGVTNMASEEGKYDLRDLSCTTAPLWFLGRTNATSPSPVVLEGASVALPRSEFHALAAGLGASTAATDGAPPSPAFNHSVKAFELGAFTNTSGLLVFSLVGLSGVVAAQTHFCPANNAMTPFAAALPDNVYSHGSSVVARRDSTKIDGLAIGLSVGLACAAAAVGAAAIAVIVARRRMRQAASNVDVSSGSGSVRNHPPGLKELEDTNGTGCSGEPSPFLQSKEQQQGSSDAQDRIGSPAMLHVTVSDPSNATDGSKPVPKAPMQELQSMILDLAEAIKDKHLTVLGPIGRGGFATVYKGMWRGIDVAVKLVDFEDKVVDGVAMQRRALTEAAICANIQHNNIVTTYSFDIRPAMAAVEGQQGRVQSSALLGLTTNGAAVAVAGPAAAPLVSLGPSSGGQAITLWRLVLIQEFCEAGSLRQALDSKVLAQADGQPNMVALLRLALDVARGLQHLHKKNIIHGDLTPSNVLLRQDARPAPASGDAAGGSGGGPVKAAATLVTGRQLLVAKLADFGLSVKMKETETSVDNMRRGTPFYASPEVRQHGSLTKASDVYAFGVILWELFCQQACYQRVRGSKNFTHASGYPLLPAHCPPPYAQLTAACMSRAPEQRPSIAVVYNTLQEMLAVAVGLLQGQGPGGSSGLNSGKSSDCSAMWIYGLASWPAAAPPPIPQPAGTAGLAAGSTAAGLTLHAPQQQPQQLQQQQRHEGASPGDGAAHVELGQLQPQHVAPLLHRPQLAQPSLVGELSAPPGPGSANGSALSAAPASWGWEPGASPTAKLRPLQQFLLRHLPFPHGHGQELPLRQPQHGQQAQLQRGAAPLPLPHEHAWGAGHVPTDAIAAGPAAGLAAAAAGSPSVTIEVRGHHHSMASHPGEDVAPECTRVEEGFQTAVDDSALLPLTTNGW